MGQRDKVGFELGGRQVNALFQHAVEVDAEGIQITGSGRCVIRNGFVVKEYGEHGTEAVALYGHTCFSAARCRPPTRMAVWLSSAAHTLCSSM